jgi:Helicase associated domain
LLSIASFIPVELRCFQENPALGHWVSNQRQKYKTGTMEECRRRRLQELGFLWEMRRGVVKRNFNAVGQPHRGTPTENDADCRWDLKFAELRSYRAAHGHCNVPVHDSVRRFCMGSIVFHYFPEVSNSHISLGRVHSSIPLELRCFQENPVLGHWVKNQRKKYKTGTMDESRKRRLQELGFVWDTRFECGKNKKDLRWDAKFEELRCYCAVHGHCNVPLQDRVRRFLHWFNNLSLYSTVPEFSRPFAVNCFVQSSRNFAVFRRIRRSDIGLAISAKNTRWGQWQKAGSLVYRNWAFRGSREAYLSREDSAHPDTSKMAIKPRVCKIATGIQNLQNYVLIMLRMGTAMFPVRTG